MSSGTKMLAIRIAIAVVGQCRVGGQAERPQRGRTGLELHQLMGLFASHPEKTTLCRDRKLAQRGRVLDQRSEVEIERRHRPDLGGLGRLGGAAQQQVAPGC